MSDTLDDLPTISSGDSNEPLFTPSLVLDSRLDVKSSLGFAIQKSAQNCTAHSARASSATVSGVSWDIVVPSLSTIIDRKMVVRSTLTFLVQNTANDLPIGDYLLKWGINCGMQPFAFQNLCGNINTTINNSNYTFEAADLLAPVMRLLAKDVMDEYCDMQSPFLDNYGKYSDTFVIPTGGTSANARPKENSPFSGYANAYLGQEGRGAYNLVSINSTATQTGNTISSAGFQAKSFTVVVEVCEPLIFSPFLLSDSYKTHNGQGMYGIQQMSFQASFSGGATRALRGAFTPSTSITLVDIDQSKTFLDMVFMTGHASLKMPARNIIPYTQLQSFKTAITSIAGGVSPINPTQVLISSNTYTLNQIPDSIIICVRPNLANRGSQVADSFLPITSCNITFNNTPGLLSSNTSAYQLWQMSKNNGCNQTWNEFRGYSLEQTTLTSGTVNGGAFVANATVPMVSTVSVDATAPKFVATTGSILKLDFARDIVLTSDWLAPGVIGQFSIQVSVNVWDNTRFGPPGPVADLANYELSLCMVNSGFIVNSLGSSSSYLGIVSKSQVLEASASGSAVSSSSLSRLYGSGMHPLSGMPKGAGRSAGGRSGGNKMADRFV